MTIHRYTVRFSLAFAWLAFALTSSCAAQDEHRCTGTGDRFLITNVALVDGTGAAPVAARVRVSGGRIGDVGSLVACPGEPVIDGGGQVLAPGFIDTHSHADEDILEFPDALPVSSQGITTVVVGQDGVSPYPLDGFFRALEAAPAAVNVAAYAGHNTLREKTLGHDAGRPASHAEVAAMAALLGEELDSGALGLSTGLEYEPGLYSDTAEVLALARVAAAAGGRYVSHIRSEDRWFEDAVDEAILIGRETGIPVHISHIKLAMRRLWGSADELLLKLDTARAGGVTLSADLYPYAYWQATMMVLLPERDYTARDAIAEALADIAPADGIRFTVYDPDPNYVGKTLSEIAAARGVDAVTAFTDLAAAAERMEQVTGSGAESIIGTSMQEADIVALLQWSGTNVCSDGGIVDRHPRARGAFPRVLGRYVRERRRLSLATAVHKMTGLAADHVGLVDRGRIRAGMRADLVLFDPDTVIDRATPLQPDRLSTGITAVWVNGVQVFAAGKVTGARPGRVLRRQ